MRLGVIAWVCGGMFLGCFVDVDAPGPTDGVGETSGGEGQSSTGGPTGASTGASTEASSSSGASTDPSVSGSETTTTTESTGEPACPPCVEPPGPCQSDLSTCVDGVCTYVDLDQGSPCDDDDACTTKGVCEAGVCVGETIACEAANAVGVCVDGACGDWECAGNWGNCDGSWENGCEVPVGVANQCDAEGLNPEGGCWTAYCGAAEGVDVHNFGDYYCVECDNCRTPGEGLVQWCSHGNGTWFPPGDGACSAQSENAVCAAP